MANDSDGLRQDSVGEAPAPDPKTDGLRVISWNLLHVAGAGVKEVAGLIERHHPDLLLMQEATEALAALPEIVGGYFFREPLHARRYGLAAWSPHRLPPSRALPLPVSALPGRVPPRIAQIVRFGDIAFANVHLSHGQFLNRWQLLHIARSLDGTAAVIGDFNAVGPIRLSGFEDVGPRAPTLTASSLISFRLDRCMVRGLRCTEARVLERGPSDHHPIVLNLNHVSTADGMVRLEPVASHGLSSISGDVSLPTG